MYNQLHLDVECKHLASINILATQSLGLYEWKQRKPYFDDECSQFLNQRMQAKMQ